MLQVFDCVQHQVDDQLLQVHELLLGSYKVTKDLYEKYGELRVLDTPIAGNSFTGMAVGAAMTGLRPIVEGMNMGFLLLAFNQISNNMGMLRYTSGGNYKIPAAVSYTHLTLPTKSTV